MRGSYLENDTFSKSQKRELAKTSPRENHRRSSKVSVRIEKGGGTNAEDDLWNKRASKVPFSDDPIPTFDVEIVPGDKFVIRGSSYIFKGVNCYNRSKLLFRPLDEDGDETEYTTNSVYMQVDSERFADAFGAPEDLYFECRRVSGVTRRISVQFPQVRWLSDRLVEFFSNRR